MVNIPRRSKFEEVGEDAVRAALEMGSFTEDKARQARTWLQELDRTRAAEDRERNDSSNREQIRIAHSAKNAAWAAAIAAIIAAVSAIIAVYSK